MKEGGVVSEGGRCGQGGRKIGLCPLKKSVKQPRGSVVNRRRLMLGRFTLECGQIIDRAGVNCGQIIARAG